MFHLWFGYFLHLCKHEAVDMHLGAQLHGYTKKGISKTNAINRTCQWCKLIVSVNISNSKHYCYTYVSILLYSVHSNFVLLALNSYAPRKSTAFKNRCYITLDLGLRKRSVFSKWMLCIFIVTRIPC